MAKTILTVDDSASIRQMVSFTLKEAGYSVTEAVDGQDGLDKARAGRFNLIFTDQNMPRMDGLTLIKQLRALPQYLGADPDADHRIERCDEGAGPGGGSDRLAGQALRSPEAAGSRAQSDRLTRRASRGNGA
jgi:CheY-like chemotaxis protein